MKKPAKQNASLRIAGDRVVLEGPVTFQTVPCLHQLAHQFATVKPIPEIIDLQNVSQADSSALALLLEWQGWAQQHQHQFKLINVPSGLQALARVMGIDQILPMEEAA